MVSLKLKDVFVSMAMLSTNFSVKHSMAREALDLQIQLSV